jgi:hypothetical protein
LASVKITINDAGQPQGWIEAVARVREMGLRGRGPQTRIDAYKQQLQSRTDEVGKRRITERLQLRLGKAHKVTVVNVRR